MMGGGQGRTFPGRGFEGAGAPRQPQCITLGRLAPRHYALRRRPRCPRLARSRRRGVQAGCRYRDDSLEPSGGHGTAERADPSGFPTGGETYGL